MEGDFVQPDDDNFRRSMIVAVFGWWVAAGFVHEVIRPYPNAGGIAWLAGLVFWVVRRDHLPVFGRRVLGLVVLWSALILATR